MVSHQSLTPLKARECFPLVSALSITSLGFDWSQSTAMCPCFIKIQTWGPQVRISRPRERRAEVAQRAQGGKLQGEVALPHCSGSRCRPQIWAGPDSCPPLRFLFFCERGKGCACLRWFPIKDHGCPRTEVVPYDICVYVHINIKINK